MILFIDANPARLCGVPLGSREYNGYLLPLQMDGAVRLALVLLLSKGFVQASPLNNCPMANVRQIIQRAALAARDPATQMQMIRRILEDVHGGTWGVLIVRDPNLVSQDVHWTIPDHVNRDGSAAFCLAVVRGNQYNVFKTGSEDIADRVTIEDFVARMRHSDSRLTGKRSPTRLSIAEFDQRLAQAIDLERKRRRFRTRRKEASVYGGTRNFQ